MKLPFRIKLVACFSLKKNLVGSGSVGVSWPWPSPRLMLEDSAEVVVSGGIGGAYDVGEAFCEVWPFCGLFLFSLFDCRPN